MKADVAGFIQMIRHPVKFRMFMMAKLPSAYFAGVRIAAMNEDSCAVTVPYKWFTQNPFRSTYFACLSMAAEMSTGALAMAHLHRIKPKVSMLVTAIEGSFIKKATGLTTFTCEEGPVIRQAIAEAISYGKPREIKARSVGSNTNGEVVAEFYISWSFKVRGMV